MTGKTPAHVLARLRFSNRHFGHIPVAGLAGNSGADMRLMIEVDKFRLNGNRHPWNWLIIGHKRSQFFQFG